MSITYRSCQSKTCCVGTVGIHSHGSRHITHTRKLVGMYPHGSKLTEPVDVVSEACESEDLVHIERVMVREQ
jgi:hypothetical protein